MASKDERIDAYIFKSADFAKPILNHLRELVHKNCPQVQEAIKWSFPNFEYKGSILCSMASFKQHCTFGFWLGSLLKDPHKLLKKGSDKNAMGQLGQLKSLNDLPPDKIMGAYIKDAMALIDNGIKLPKKKSSLEKNIEIPPYFLNELQKNKKALETFEKFSPSHKKEYLEWITGAKTEDTRNKRMATTLEWLHEGKSLNWKYERK